MGDEADALNDQFDGHEGLHACRRCGLDGLHWVETEPRRWRLAEPGGDIHWCTPKPKAAKHPITEAEELDLRRRCERAEAFCRAWERWRDMPCGFCTSDDLNERAAAEKGLAEAYANWKKGQPK